MCTSFVYLSNMLKINFETLQINYYFESQVPLSTRGKGPMIYINSTDSNLDEVVKFEGEDE